MLTNEMLERKFSFFGETNTTEYTYDIGITHNTTDATPPVPPTISMASATPTSSAFSYFTLSTCADGPGTINGVYVGVTGNTPTSSQSGWVPCTTNAGGLKSFPLSEGTNHISFWFKDAAGNIAVGSQAFDVDYNPPSTPNPNFYLAFDHNGGVQPEFSQIGPFIRDVSSSIPFNIGDSANAFFKFNGVVSDAAEFDGASYLESKTYNPTLGNQLAVSAWVNIPAPTLQASIVNQWDGTAANNRFAVTIDSVGRLCFDYQTTNSSGSASWGTSFYKHTCSLDKVVFANWNHVALIRNGTSVLFYVNGILSNTDTIDSANLKTSSLTLRTGGQQRTGGYSLLGQVDEVAFYTSSLTTQQVEKIYSRGYNDVSIIDDIQPQEAGIPYLYFDMDSAYYNLPSANFLQPNYPISSTIYFTDLNAGSPNNYTSATTGLGGEARQFYGKNILETNTSAISMLNDFSMSVWAKPSVIGSGHVLISKWEASTGVPASQAIDQFQLVLDENFGAMTTKFYYHTTDSTVWNNVAFSMLTSSSAFIQDGNWHHIAVVRSGTYLSLYVDGFLNAMANIGTAPFVNSTQKLRVGGMNSTATGTYIGLVDEFNIWDKALTERQIMKLYLHGVNNQTTVTTFKLSAAHHSNTIKATLPTTNAKLSLNDCSTYTEVLVQASTDPTPTSGDSRWVACTTAIGAINSPNLISGANNLDLWMKTGGTVDPSPAASITITVTP